MEFYISNTNKPRFCGNNNRIKMNTVIRQKKRNIFFKHYNSYTEHDKILVETLLNKNEHIQTRIEIN